MKIHFLGTNGWFNSQTGETSCVLIDCAEGYIIFDAGNAFRKIDRHITGAKPIYLFLSHLHLDHTYGLHTMPKFRFAQGITIIGQKGTKKAITKFFRSPWSGDLTKMATKVSFRDVREGDHTEPFPFGCRFLVHADPCLGYRLTIESKVVTYCTDTGVCDNLARLAGGADLFICECAWRKQNQTPRWPHMAPEDGATVAKQAGAQRLALVHFDGHGYPSQAERDDAESRARTIFPQTQAMHDDEVIEL